MDIFGPPQSTYLNGTTRVIRTPPAPQGGGIYPCNVQSKPEKESEMYPQCRHVRTGSDRCHAAAIKGGHWCFFHARLHDQQAQRVAREAQRRSRDARSQHRLTDGTFAPPEETLSTRASTPSKQATIGSLPLSTRTGVRMPRRPVSHSSSRMSKTAPPFNSRSSKSSMPLPPTSSTPAAPASSSTRSRSPQPTPKTSTSTPTASAPSATPKKASPSPPRNTAGM